MVVKFVAGEFTGSSTKQYSCNGERCYIVPVCSATYMFPCFTEAARTYYNSAACTQKLKMSGKYNTKCVQQQRRNRRKRVSDMKCITKHNYAHFHLHAETDIMTSGFTEVYIYL